MSTNSPPPLDSEYFDQFDNSEEAKRKATESNREFTEEREKQETEKRLELASDVSTQEWLEHETTRETEIIPFRGREFEWKEPGVIHRTKMIDLAKEFGPEDIQDPNNDGEIDEVLEETFDAEGLQTVIDLYDHVLRTLAELCVDPEMGDTTVPDNEDLPLGALRWGQFPEEDDGGREGLTTLFRGVVMERFEDDEDEPITVEDESRIDDF